MSSIDSYPQFQPYCPPPSAEISAGLLDAAKTTVGDAVDTLEYAINGGFTAVDAQRGAEYLLNGVDMLAIAFPQASGMTGRFASHAQEVLASPTTSNAQILLADARSAITLIEALRPQAR